ncbi:DUF4221 family protein [Cyclobacterium plantarum]|uniref:DUF4221 family protein n=1 Tax=Cyclobacterium plantarum TaxID=2716263 RepID=A0ABX0H1X9_9BACT|nr:DUF4221 family protein [Cyclobacterium plantarum]NHE55799.1 DUF4221 family protein [Cyclobacterium plantarum]
MKNHFTVLLIIGVLNACSTPSSRTDQVEGIDIFIDTVLIDTGEDFINLKSGIYFSGLSNDGKHLFNSGGTSPYLERINLETLKFEEKMDFDVDGPNAFGDYVYGVSSDVNNNLILTSHFSTSIFNIEKQKLKEYLLIGRNFKGDELVKREQFTSKIIPTSDYNIIFGLVENHDTGEIFFAILNEETDVLRKVKLNEFEKAIDFTVRYQQGRGASVSPQNSEIVRLGNKLVITNPVFSNIAVYDLVEENLKYYACLPTLTASEKSGTYTREVNSREEFNIRKIEIGKEVTFLPLMRDSTNNQYVRMSIIGQPKMNDNGLPEMNDHKVFVSILNDSFEVTKEAEVADGIGKLFSTPIPQKPFMKDGKVWLYLNVNDELAFVRLDLDA